MPLMRNFILALAIVACASAATAQPRDGGLNESLEAAAAEGCADAPECVAAAKRVRAQKLRDEARAEAIYQAKPAWQKLLGWLVIPAVFLVLWRWAGSGKPRSNPPTEDSSQ